MQNMKKDCFLKWRFREPRQKNVDLEGGKDKSIKRQMKRKYLQCYFLEAYYYFLYFLFPGVSSTHHLWITNDCKRQSKQIWLC